MIVIEDDILRENLSEELSKLTNLEPLLAKDGVEAYQKTRNQDFCVVLSEFNLKKLSGAQLILAARETKANESTPFIFYTSSIAKAKAGTRGIKGISFFEKPTEIKFIADKIKDVIVSDNIKFLNNKISTILQILEEE